MNKTKRLLALFCVFLIISISFVFAKEYSLSYDSRGNLQQGIDEYYEYDSYNKLSKIREDDQEGRILAEYFYDVNGDRIKKIEYDHKDNPTITYYPSKNSIRIVNSSGTYNVTLAYVNNKLIAKETNGKKEFYHEDYLGSTRVVTDENGNLIEKLNYLPFGEKTEYSEQEYTFTGQEDEISSSLMFYNSRYYSPEFRRFTQPDMMIQNAYDPQSLNRYGYARNNPLKYIDPNGHSFLLALGAAITFILAATTPYWGPYLTGYFAEMNINDVGRAISDPSSGNLIWGGLAAYDLATPGVPESAMAKGAASKLDDAGRKILSSANDLRADFYVRQGGDVIQSRAYHHIGSNSPRLRKVKDTMRVTPGLKSGKTWVSFTKIDDAEKASYLLQTPGKNSFIRTEFDTLQIIDDIEIPRGAGGKLITHTLPDGKGAYQATTHSPFNIDGLQDLRKLNR